MANYPVSACRAFLYRTLWHSLKLESALRYHPVPLRKVREGDLELLRQNRNSCSLPVNAACESAALRSDGRIVLVGGTSSTSISVASVDSADEPNGNSWAYAGLVTRLNPDGSPDSGFGLGGSYPYIAPTSGNSPSYYTGFKRLRFDGAQPVIIGSSVDSTSSVVDFDGVITRLQSDLIFANGFEAQP